MRLQFVYWILGLTVINYADHAIGLEIKCLINVYFFEPPADSPHSRRQSPIQSSPIPEVSAGQGRVRQTGRRKRHACPC